MIDPSLSYDLLRQRQQELIKQAQQRAIVRQAQQRRPRRVAPLLILLNHLPGR